MSTTDRSPRLSVALAWIDGFNARDADLVVKHYDESCQHEILPKSLNRPIRGKEEVRPYLKSALSWFRVFNVSIIEAIDAPKDRKIVMHAKSTGESAIDDAAPYVGEYTLIVTFNDNETDPKIIHVKEFVDSGHSLRWFPAERERRTKLGLPIE